MVKVKVSPKLRKRKTKETKTMSGQPVSKWINEKLSEYAKLQDELSKIQRIEKKYPDLTYSMDRWKNFRLHSEKVNCEAVDVSIHHSCGCCNDATLLARPYIEVDGMTIYAVPESFYIGEKGYGCEVPNPGWRTTLVEAHISGEVIKKIEAYFEDHKRYECDDEDDDYVY